MGLFDGFGMTAIAVFLVIVVDRRLHSLTADRTAAPRNECNVASSKKDSWIRSKLVLSPSFSGRELSGPSGSQH